MARQMLSLLAGDTIDLWLVRQLKGLTSGHSVARAILSLQSILWPGGVWFAWANQQREQRQQQQEMQRQRRPEADSDPVRAGDERPAQPWVPTWQPPTPMRADRFLEPANRPSDEDEMRTKALERILGKCPNTVLANLGQKTYTKSMTELHGMMQSSTFTLQVLYVEALNSFALNPFKQYIALHLFTNDADRVSSPRAPRHRPHS